MTTAYQMKDIDYETLLIDISFNFIIEKEYKFEVEKYFL